MGYLLGVIGYPVKHSLSPWIHDQFLQLANQNGIYRSYELEDFKLAQSMEVLKAMEIDGFNVTIPYKEKIISYLDELDESAKNVGAVNTVVSQNGKWVGFNTDGKGYISSLQAAHPHFFEEVHSKKVLIIGAGGAARGVYNALNDKGFTYINIANRTVSRAKNLLSIKKESTHSVAMSLQEAEKSIDGYDLIVQTTNIGMTPETNAVPLKFNKLKHNAIISDIIYNPLETAFLKKGRQLGANVHYGHGMLLYQAAAAFELWTGINIDPAPLLSRLEHQLK